MIEQFDKLIFIDLETTGPNPATDRITEVGIVEVDRAGTRHWSTLVNPEVPIPPFIQHLTGINDDMVREAPLFEAIEQELLERLDGGLFIAHNARFDYGFLRSAYRRLGKTLRCESLCTVKLSRKLFPHELRHSLDAIVERHGLLAQARHRALADADLLWQYWQRLEASFPPATLRDTVGQLLQRPGLPGHLAPELLDDLPDGPGVYVLRGDADAVLHIGKATQLRPRILTHFHGAQSSSRDQWLARELRRVECHETAGEIGAQLLQAKMSRELKLAQGGKSMPRQEHVAWQLQSGPDGNVQLRLCHEREPDFARADRLYGLFNARQKADMALRALVDTHGLCPSLLGLETSPAGTPCGARLKGRCRGACMGKETLAQHARRVEEALSSLKLLSWPYRGPVALIETAGGRSDMHVLDNWCWLGTARSETELRGLLEDAPASPGFDAETYRIVSRALAGGKARVRLLEPKTPESPESPALPLFA